MTNGLINLDVDEAASISRLAKVYESDSAPLVALQDISFSLKKGQFTTLVGPSGCGKSTLLQIMGGLVAPSQGEITIFGFRLAGPRPADVAIVFQEALLLPWKTALENIAFPLTLQGRKSKQSLERAKQLLELVGLADFGDRYPRELSGGMRQRIAIARALAPNPRLLLMDEPFAALDEQTRTRMGGELLRIWEQTKQTIFFITHGLTEAIFLADEVLVMQTKPGRIVERIRVELPRPRTFDMMGTEYFGRLRNHIWTQLAETGE
jgi:NitT/TauT family transport system ATP-binding protein